MATDRDLLDRLTAGAPTGDELVGLLVDAFAGCPPEVLDAPTDQGDVTRQP